jgi:hypothetical protein
VAIHWASRHTGRRTNWWIGVLFAIGSTCFFVGPFPGFVDLVGSAADGIVFFVGSLFFTSAALLQALTAQGRDRLPSLIQFAGTVFFNVDTFRALQTSIDDSRIDRLIWAPELAGSICFLASGLIAYRDVRAAGHAAKRNTEWRIAAINLAGCVLFMISTIASYVVPKTGDVLALAAANWTTALGALCFLIGALLLIPWRADSARDRSATAPAPSA